MLFIDYSSAFNTIVPSKLVTKLRDLGINSALCDWILNFLTGRPQAVRMGSTTSSTLTLNTGAPRAVCSALCCMPIVKFAGRHDCHRPDHRLTTRRPTERRERNTPPSPSTGLRWRESSSFRFLGVLISEHLTWTNHTDFITKSARQQLFCSCSFYRCTIERILTGCITAWYSSCTASIRVRTTRLRETASYRR
ncbi:hypothetical protein L3Q82_023158 [Scortum barcoo]|uniref:Uncharacterized protein n=1 Tax=Scortum barcoo TaxID=214431 RepID=A0ACB8WXH7_9TELE|nr:hypothetical protein L3Q82_023158 [Scortum barcoo]